MIFLSAVPDEYYFIWQIKIQLFNFSKLGIQREDIHIIIGYDRDQGLSNHFAQFIEEYEGYASFFSYPDKRIVKRYPSSIRPNIIKQHFFRFNSLSKSVIFYHDSDIVFSHLPDFEPFLDDEVIYVSDTKSYTGSDYILSFGEVVLDEMCEVVGIDKQTVIDNELNSGGAQYILKHVDYEFWNKIEIDSEALYALLIDNREKYALNFEERTGTPKNEYKFIQDWCSDMWAILWNLFKMRAVKVVEQLHFTWPHDPLEDWDKFAIFHNSGVTEINKRHFFKGQYKELTPAFEYFDGFDNQCCGFKYAELIAEADQYTLHKLPDCAFLMVTDAADTQEKNNVLSAIKHIKKFFEARIMLVELGDHEQLRNEVFGIDDLIYHHEHADVHTIASASNKYIRELSSDIVINYNPSSIIFPDQILKTVVLLRSDPLGMRIPYNNALLVSHLQSAFFNNHSKLNYLSKKKSSLQKEVSVFSNMTHLFTRKLFLDSQGYDENSLNRFSAHKQFCRKMLRNGIGIYFDPGVSFNLYQVKSPKENREILNGVPLSGRIKMLVD